MGREMEEEEVRNSLNEVESVRSAGSLRPRLVEFMTGVWMMSTVRTPITVAINR